jgi:NAD(P)-dependent dehydrogenase (short-subunit alcohol dehydrogenase family)
VRTNDRISREIQDQSLSHRWWRGIFRHRRIQRVSSGQTALGRYAKPSEVAALVTFLAGPESADLAGGCFNIDGGFTA